MTQAHHQEKHNSAITLVFGASTGLAILTGEVLVCLITGELPALPFLLLGPLAYGLFGFGVAASALLLTAGLHYLFGSARLLHRHLPVLVATAGAWAQGLIVINELLLFGSHFSSRRSIFIDLIWALCIACLFLLISYLHDGLRSQIFKPALLFGSALSSMCFLSLYHLLDTPTAIEIPAALIQVLLLFMAVAVSFLVPSFAPRIVFQNRHVSNYVPFIATTISAVITFALFTFIFFALPKEKFEVCTHHPRIEIAKKPNVILLVVDTLRADHLSCYGYDRRTSPNIDKFSKTAVLYSRCYSPANWTAPGHAAIFTGRFPISNGVHKSKPKPGDSRDFPTCFALPKEEVTLAEVLSSHGYRTAAVVANFGYVSKSLGLDQGFQYWFATPPKRLVPSLVSITNKIGCLDESAFLSPAVPYRPAPDISEIALRWIRQYGDQPFFMFINIMDPHGPYLPPSPWNQLFDGKIEGFNPNLDALRDGTATFSSSQWKHINSQYDGEVAYVDHEFQRFVELLGFENHLSDTIIILTSDHGEFLGERGLLDHQIALYDPVIKVPLIIKVPEVFSQQKFQKKIAQTIDIMPTILDLLNIPEPAELQGISLLKKDAHSIIAQHFADAHIQTFFGGRFGSGQTALVERQFKLIKSDNYKVELFNLTVDSGEIENLANRENKMLGHLLESIRTWERSADARTFPKNTSSELDQETIEKLRTLGYVK